jgi:uncharacterized protein YndB with AHSA1/START domain
MDTDRIEKKVLLKAPRNRIWRALTDSQEFGSWFGMKVDGPFVAGTTVQGTIAPTTVDPNVAKMQEAHAGLRFELVIDRIEPERLFSLKWHPYAIDPSIDYSKEPMTLITFTLEDVEGGILLTITESGFDKLPLSRRLEAIKANDGGWAKQAELITKYLANAKQSG